MSLDFVLVIIGLSILFAHWDVRAHERLRTSRPRRDPYAIPATPTTPPRLWAGLREFLCIQCYIFLVSGIAYGLYLIVTHSLPSP